MSQSSAASSSTATPEEQAVLKAVIEKTVSNPELVSAVDDLFPMADVEQHLLRQTAHDQTWRGMSRARARLEVAGSDLASMSLEVRKGIPEIAEDDASWIEREESIKNDIKRANDYVSKCKAAVTNFRNEAISARTTKMVESIDAALASDTAKFPWEESTARNKRFAGSVRGTFGRLHRRGRKSPKPTREEDLQLQYQEALEKLSAVRRQREGFYLARHRREDAIAPTISAAEAVHEGYLRLKIEFDEALNELATALEYEAVLPIARRFINERMGRLFRTQVEVKDPSGLYDVGPQHELIVTPAIRRVESLISKMSGSSIGLAGPRGAGKSALIDYFCPEATIDRSPSRTPVAAGTSQVNRAGIRVSAPVQYDAREFILHLYAKLCEAAIGQPDTRDDAYDDSEARSRVANILREMMRRMTFLLGPTLTLIGSLFAARVAAENKSLLIPAALLIAVSALLAIHANTLSFAPLNPSIEWGPPTLRPTVLFGVLSAIGVVIAEEFANVSSDVFRLLSSIASVIVAVNIILTTVYNFQATLHWPPDSRAYPRAVLALSGKSVFAALGGLLVSACVVDNPPRPSALLLGCALLVAATLVWTLAVILERAQQSAHLPTGGARAYSNPAVDYPESAAFTDDRLRDEGVLSGFSRYILSSTVLLSLLRGVAGLAALAGAYLSVSSYVATRSGVSRSIMVTGVFVLFGLVAALHRRGSPRQSDTVDYPRIQQSDADIDRMLVVRLAREHLREIRFQQTFRRDWSRALTLSTPAHLPVSVNAGRSGGTTFARSPQGLPEIVQRFRDFAAAFARRQELVIGIDELDKLPPEKTEQFLNDIKAIFGIRNCHFLVSVSEDAEASFQRRGVPFRTVFDSCFDELVSVDYLDRNTSTDLLYGRAIGISTPLVWASHVLSAGLARDLIRYARSLIATPELALNSAIANVCYQDLRDKIRAVSRELSNVPEDPWAQGLGKVA